MKFEKTEEKLSELIDRAAKEDPQIRESLETAGFEGRGIHDEIALERESIWEVVLDEIKGYDSATDDL